MKSHLVAAAFVSVMLANQVQAELVVGWNTFTTGSFLDIDAPEDFSDRAVGSLGSRVSIANPLQGGGFNVTPEAHFAGNTTYGTAFEIGNEGAASGIIINSLSDNNRFIDFDVFNISGVDLILERIHFDAGMQFNDNMVENRSVLVSHFSSAFTDLDDAFPNRVLGGTGIIDANDFEYRDYDIDLASSGMTDLVLADSEIAAFRIFIDDNTTSNNYGFRIDNIGISGSFATSIPEPNGAITITCILGVVASRRRRSA